MYWPVLVHRHVDGPHGITNFLDFGGVVGHRHIPLSNIVELLPELQLYGRRACREDLQVHPSFFGHLRVPDVVKKLITDSFRVHWPHPQ